MGGMLKWLRDAACAFDHPGLDLPLFNSYGKRYVGCPGLFSCTGASATEVGWHCLHTCVLRMWFSPTGYFAWARGLHNGKSMFDCLSPDISSQERTCPATFLQYMPCHLLTVHALPPSYSACPATFLQCRHGPGHVRIGLACALTLRPCLPPSSMAQFALLLWSSAASCTVMQQSPILSKYVHTP